MKTDFLSRFKNAWNAFRLDNPSYVYRPDLGMSWGSKPDLTQLSLGNERSIIASIYTRIAIDAASIDIHHVRTDENGRFLSIVDSGLENCLSLEANIDQTARAFIRDIVLTMFDEGSVAIVPVDTDVNILKSNSYEIYTMRVGHIREWFPEYIRVEVYNDKTGRREDITIPKTRTAIIENPFYMVMNEPNSTLRRLVRKLNMLDQIDAKTSSGKLDLIIQLPYVVKSKTRQLQAEDRRKDIEMQLDNSKLGIAYTDGVEKIVQLNRPLENNLQAQIEYLTKQLYGQLGISEEILNGTADEKQMLNYNNRTIEPIMSAITDAIKRVFLTKTARSQGQDIMFFREPFRLVPVENLAEMADTFTRNEILTSNEFRSLIGFKPDADPRADELRNKNLNAENDQLGPVPELQNEIGQTTDMSPEELEMAMADMDDFDNQLNELEDRLNE